MSTFKKKKRAAKPVKISPEHQQIFDELCEAFAKIGVQVKMENGRFEGGYCVVNGEEFVYLNKNNLIEQNIQVLAEQLNLFDSRNIYLSPRVRNYLNDDEFRAEES